MTDREEFAFHYTVSMKHCLLLTFLAGLAHGTLITNDISSVSFWRGTAGLAVANRLAVNRTVLVVERGEDLAKNEMVNKPYGLAAAILSPCFSYLNSTPQIGSNETRRSLALGYGNCLGGSSSVNGMIAARPTFAGMDAIEALGNPGWGWNDFLPYMQRSESFAIPDPTQLKEGANYIAAVHGHEGPVGVSFSRPLNAPALQSIAKSTIQSVFDEEVTLSPDMGNGFSGGHVSSFYHLIHFNETLQTDRRSSSSWSYLYPPTQQRAGLIVLTEHRVNSILTRTSASGNITATGVLVEPTRGGRISVFNASREIILSAGALQSPAILQRSGIGNTSYLQTLGIQPVVNLPGVGSNFQDQICLPNATFSLAPFANKTNITADNNILHGIVVTHPTARDVLERKGSTNMYNLLRNTSSNYTVSVGGVVNSRSLAIQADVIVNALRIDRNQYLTVFSQTVVPLSRGSIRISTVDPSVDPIADPQYLALEGDMLAASAVARAISRIAVTPPFNNFLAENALEDSGIPKVHASEDEIREWVLDTYASDFHFVGSNSMMPEELGGVVSPQLLVYGEYVSAPQRTGSGITVFSSMPVFPSLAHASLITNDLSNVVQHSFEFIVIGGGTAGLTVANRLAVNHTVLVIERGEDMADNEMVNNPYSPGAGILSPCFSFLNSTPQTGLHTTRRSLVLGYGNCLGGSSSVNGMIAARPTFAGMDAIEALGNPGWGWNDFLPYMQRSESFAIPDPTQLKEGANYIAAVHGYEGPVGVSFSRPLNAPALQSIAKNTTQTVFDEEVTLSPDMGNGFSGEHRVNSILTTMNANGNILATGVLVEPTRGGPISVFNASREIILSAGALQSPAILQRSGIGNTSYLQTLGIQPVLNLPGVGSNFQDQICLPNATFSLAPFANTTNITADNNILYGIVVTHPTARDVLGRNGSTTMYNLLQNTSSNSTISVGGVSSRQRHPPAEDNHVEPFIEIYFAPGNQYLTVLSQTVVPLSRGSIRISTIDPSVDPIADPQYLALEGDMLAASAVARAISRIAVTTPFNDLLTENALKDSGIPEVNASEDEVRKWVLDT
ncbi:GMC oxidoreductase-domain-containing protein [Lentinula raphanica]|nr:GMC oxidoreductase-domain-containing protein [Lentinula raphanica]